MAGKASSPGFHETAIGKEIAAIRARAKAEAKTKSKRAEGPKVERRPWTKAEQRSLTKAWLETTLSATEIGKQLGRWRRSIIAKASLARVRLEVRHAFDRLASLINIELRPRQGALCTTPWSSKE